jgi:hypothetical protein
MAELLFPDGCAVQSRDHQVTCTPLRDFPDLMPTGEATLEEQFHHPGTNILSFLKQDGRWRVSAIADNGRTGPRPVDWDQA